MKKITILIGLLAIVGVIVGVMVYHKPHQDIRSAKTEVSIASTDLFADYETDEAGANAKYLDKIIEVRGRVMEAKTDVEGNIAVTLDGGSDMFGVICQFDNLTSHQRTDFPVGQEVAFKGICTGLLMDVVLARCVEVGK